MFVLPVFVVPVRDQKCAKGSVTVNRSTPCAFWQRLSRSCAVLILLVGLSGCAVTALTPTGWQAPIALADTSPQTQPALWIGHKRQIVAEHSPTINLLTSGNPAKALPLGHDVRQLALYGGNADTLHMTWLDQADLAHPTDTRLFSAYLASDLTLLRGPTLISTAATLDYAALPLPSGALLTLWSSRVLSDPNSAATLTMQIIDPVGRPRPARTIAKNAAHPVLASDRTGHIDMAWLEPLSSHLWAIRFLQIKGEPDETSTLPTPTSIGLIQVEADHALETFALATDSAAVYALWGESDVRNADGTVWALSFVPDQPTQIVQFLVAEHARWPSVSVMPTDTLAIALTLSDQGHTVPAVAIVNHQQTVRLDRFAETGTVSHTMLAADSNQVLALSWFAVQADGSTLLMLTRAISSE